MNILCQVIAEQTTELVYLTEQRKTPIFPTTIDGYSEYIMYSGALGIEPVSLR